MNKRMKIIICMSIVLMVALALMALIVFLLPLMGTICMMMLTNHLFPEFCEAHFNALVYTYMISFAIVALTVAFIDIRKDIPEYEGDYEPQSPLFKKLKKWVGEK